MFDFTPLRRLTKFNPWAALAPAAVACAAMFTLGTAQLQYDILYFLSIASIFVAMALLVKGLSKIQQGHVGKPEVYQEFARLNNMTYVPKAADLYTGPGTLFMHNTTLGKGHVLSGTMHDMPFEFFEYQYKFDDGSVFMSVMRIGLPRKLPHIVIDSLVESGDGSSVLPIVFDASQAIKLEGNFSEFFMAYAPNGYAVSLLSLIGPDAMQVLMRHAAKCDIEIIGDTMYFYWPYRAHMGHELEEMLTSAYEITAKIGKKLTTSNIYATQNQEYLHSAPAATGARLKFGEGPIDPLVLTLLCAVAIMFIIPHAGIAAVLLVVVMLGLLVYVLRLIIRNAKAAKYRKSPGRMRW